MSDADEVSSSSAVPDKPRFSCLTTLSTSLRIFLRNKHLYLSVFALATFPLSVLLFSLSFISQPTRSHVFHLEQSVARLSSTRVEARHIWTESRTDAVFLLRIKALFFLPSYGLSLIAAIVAVSSTVLAFNCKNPTIQTALQAVKITWKRPLFTTVYGYVTLFAYVQLPQLLAAIVRIPVLRFWVLAIGSGLEVYLMAVMSVGLVVSIAEERSGWEAIRVGSGVMKGRRFFGWVLAGANVLVTGWIGWRMEQLTEGKQRWRTVAAVMGGWEEAGLVGLYGLVIVWSYVVTTVYYCECKRLHQSSGARSVNEMVAL